MSFLISCQRRSLNKVCSCFTMFPDPNLEPVHVRDPVGDRDPVLPVHAQDVHRPPPPGEVRPLNPGGEDGWRGHRGQDEHIGAGRRRRRRGRWRRRRWRGGSRRGSSEHLFRLVDGKNKCNGSLLSFQAKMRFTAKSQVVKNLLYITILIAFMFLLFNFAGLQSFQSERHRPHPPDAQDPPVRHSRSGHDNHHRLHMQVSLRLQRRRRRMRGQPRHALHLQRGEHNLFLRRHGNSSMCQWQQQRRRPLHRQPRRWRRHRSPPGRRRSAQEEHPVRAEQRRRRSQEEQLPTAEPTVGGKRYQEQQQGVVLGAKGSGACGHSGRHKRFRWDSLTSKEI